MSRIRSRLNSLERQYGPPGSCRACAERPPGGMVMVHQNADGTERSRDAPGQCKVCGNYGPSTWIIVRDEPYAERPVVRT